MRHLLLFLFLSCSCFSAAGQYVVQGKVNLSEGWQPKIYLAAINKLSDYYRTNPDMILNTAPISADGSFHLEGKNIPEDSRYYRLYLMKDQNTDYDACLYVGGDDHNFVHLLLANGEKVEVQADPSSVAPFGAYELIGSDENRAMQELSSIVFPSFYFYRMQFPTELKFSEDRFQSELRAFASASKHPLVALAAVNNMDFDEYFEEDRAFFQDFGERLQDELPRSVYTWNYLLKLNYYSNTDGTGTERKIGLWLLGAALLICLFMLYAMKKRVNALQAQLSETKSLNLLDSLTQKEREILELIHQGKSNKEISSALFVELSTVKTHINKIYFKLGVKNRSEASSLASQLFS